MRMLSSGITALAIMTSAPAAAQTGQDQGGSSSPVGPATDYAALKAQYEAQTAAYNAATAAANARTAAIAAEQNAEKAKFGTVTGQSTITGTTTVTNNGAKPEAMLLSSRSTKLAADKAVAEIITKGAIPDAARKVIVLTDMAELSTSEISVFDFHASRLKTLLSAAESGLQNALGSVSAPPPPQDDQNRSFFTAAGAIVDLTSKLGSYFQSDYAFSGVEFTDPTNLTASAIAGALREQLPTDRKNVTIIAPATLLPGDVDPLINQLAPVETLYRSVVGYAAVAKARAEAVRAKDAKGAAILDDAVAVAGRATVAFDAFINGIVTATGTEAPPLIRILRQSKLRAHLKDQPLIALITTQKAGAYYTKKNLWTFLGGPPLYTAGTTSLVYMVIDTKTDNVVASGSVAKHGGYRSVGGVERIFQ